MKKNKKSQSGQVIVESLLTILVLSLILFGLLQIFHLSVAQMLTDYSAFYASRSYSVGFADYLVQRSGKVAAIGASGKIIYPEDTNFRDALEQLAAEKSRIPDYISGERWLDYQYWHGSYFENNDYDSRYWHTWGDGKYSVHAPDTYLSVSTMQTLSNTVRATSKFNDYPFIFFDLMDPGHDWFSRENAVDITGEAEVMNYAEDYLE